MKVKDVLAQRDSLFGREVTIEGYLVEKAPENRLYLAPDKTTREEISNSIGIELSISREKFDERLAAFVGSKYAHAEPATLTGILAPSDNGDFPAVITDLTKFTAEEYDEIIDVLSES